MESIVRQLFTFRDMRLFLLGQTLSLFGDTALYLALGIWVKQLTASNAAAGLIFFVLALPGLAAPIGGILVDRCRRRPVMIVTNVFAGCAVLLLLLVHDSDQLWLIYLVTALYGAAGVIFSSAQSALLTVLLPTELLSDGNAALQTIREALRIIGPLTGAGLFAAFGGGAVAIIDAATFGVSMLCLLAMRVEEIPAPPREQHFFSELAAGFEHILHTRLLCAIVITMAVAFLVIGFAETVVFAVVSQGLHRPVAFLGVLSALQGVGAIAGGLTASSLMKRIGDARLIAYGLGIFAAGDLLLTTSTLLPVAAGFLIAGAGLPWVVVGFGTALQQRSPAHVQGRVYAAANALTGTPQTISIGLGALLSTVLDYRILIVILSAVIATCAAFLARYKTQT